MAPIEYKPEKGVVLVAKKGLKISLKANAAISATLNMTQVNIGENGTSMGNLVLGGSLVTVLGATFKAAYNVATFSYALSAGYSVSNYVKKDTVNFQQLLAEYNEITDENNIIAESIRTAAEVRHEGVTKKTVRGSLNLIDENLQEMERMKSAMADRKTEVEADKASTVSLYTEVCQKKEELANLKKVVADLLNEVKTNSSAAVANKKVVAQNNSETGMHTFM